MNEASHLATARNNLQRVLSNNTNSSDVEGIIKAIENFVEKKIAMEFKLLQENAENGED